MAKTVVFYSKPGCCLCDSLERTLQASQAHLGFVIDKRNILDDPEWFTDFQYTIPVLEIDGQTVGGISHRSSIEQLTTVLTRLLV
ncbi:glutaredoxin family protein [Gloeobacter kilaueensis]|uniref:Glutaredoxin 2 n=1 Tax=Gloeobacter kilaueensis (strain ATCC BAA-2537 / CCAP 1431/1 / ULC 316 / JS1) TaxID=1183438 RepID=U5QFB2_GLOK1|nr:glutaredoxin family protein [Gloeobacter kilaueensis]AGY57662.1 glutaredoxin 2 [Gloeobacter kilaueensis JS1]